VDMAVDRPLGVGLGNFEASYDRYDRTGGKFGSRRAVHSSHLEVLAETGFGGAAIYAALFGYALFTGFRIRKRSRRPGLSPSLSRFYFTTANALILSMVAFLVGGAFISLALNDLTWLTFALVSSLDRLSLIAMIALARSYAAGRSRLRKNDGWSSSQGRVSWTVTTVGSGCQYGHQVPRQWSTSQPSRLACHGSPSCSHARNRWPLSSHVWTEILSDGGK